MDHGDEKQWNKSFECKLLSAHPKYWVQCVHCIVCICVCVYTFLLSFSFDYLQSQNLFCIKCSSLKGLHTANEYARTNTCIWTFLQDAWNLSCNIRIFIQIKSDNLIFFSAFNKYNHRKLKVSDDGPIDNTAPQLRQIKINKWKVKKVVDDERERERSIKSISFLMHYYNSNTSRILNTFYAMFTHSIVALSWVIYFIYQSKVSKYI